MEGNYNRDPMLELFVFETTQLIEQLESLVLQIEKNNNMSKDMINEIFRIMHTIKGSGALMMFNNISEISHSLEDLFYYFREKSPVKIDYQTLIDIILEGIDFVKCEIEKIQNDFCVDGNPEAIIKSVKYYLEVIKVLNGDLTTETENNVVCKIAGEEKFYISSNKSIVEDEHQYDVIVFFEENCEMEHIRAFTLLHEVKSFATIIDFYPENVVENDEGIQTIRDDGFKLIFISTKKSEEIKALILNTPFIKKIEISKMNEDSNDSIKNCNMKQIILDDTEIKVPQKKSEVDIKLPTNIKQDSITVGVSKLDILMDLVGELVISEAMVTRNPELEGLNLDGFYKASRQLRKITNELQDVVMSIRMVPLSATFQKMNRIVRDMSRKLSKDITLELVGEETEVDKNIIEHLSDPLMHIIRNSMDHGIESSNEREKLGKPSQGKIMLEAKNAGGDVWIVIKDDGKGLDKEKILKKARQNEIISIQDTEFTDKEIYSLIFLPGFSTNESITEFSGRGVGMDVVNKNIEEIGGSIIIDSTPNIGTTISIKIPLTLAIIDGMTIRVGGARYTVPTTSIRESFRIKEEDIIIDPDGNEMVLIRGECYPIVRLHELYNIKTDVTKLYEGIIMMVENEYKSICIFADSLIGEQQVVVKPMPKYVNKIRGIAGCTLLGDGSISLILDVSGFININK